MYVAFGSVRLGLSVCPLIISLIAFTTICNHNKLLVTVGAAKNDHECVRVWWVYDNGKLKIIS